MDQSVWLVAQRKHNRPIMAGVEKGVETAEACCSTVDLKRDAAFVTYEHDINIGNIKRHYI